MLIGILKISQTSAKKFFKPLQSLGKNPLFFFFASNISLILFWVLEFEHIPVLEWIYKNIFQGIGSTEFSSMIFCFAWCALWILLAEIFDRKNIIIKI